jgi:hypothetical protein
LRSIFDLDLTEPEQARLDEVSDLVASDYPYGTLGLEQRSRGLAGGS